MNTDVIYKMIGNDSNYIYLILETLNSHYWVQTSLSLFQFYFNLIFIFFKN